MRPEVLLIILAAWVMALATTLGSREAKPHEAPSGWSYPIECCHQLDCAPASITKIEGNDYLVSTRHGQVRGPIDFSKVRPSPDAEPHACISKDRDGKDRVICLFLPTGV